MQEDFRPDWKDAPEWAKFRVRELCGDWYYHENEPRFDGLVWRGGGRFKYIGRFDVEPICEPRPKPKINATEQTTPEQK